MFEKSGKDHRDPMYGTGNHLPLIFFNKSNAGSAIKTMLQAGLEGLQFAEPVSKLNYSRKVAI